MTGKAAKLKPSDMRAKRGSFSSTPCYIFTVDNSDRSVRERIGCEYRMRDLGVKYAFRRIKDAWSGVTKWIQSTRDTLFWVDVSMLALTEFLV
jgi:hypothetical protein